MSTIVHLTIPHPRAAGCRLSVLEPQPGVTTPPMVTYTSDLYSSFRILQWVCQRCLDAEAAGDLAVTVAMSPAYQQHLIKHEEESADCPIGFWLDRLVAQWGKPAGLRELAELADLTEDYRVLCLLL